MNTYPEHPLEDLLCECGRHLPCRHCSPDDEGFAAMKTKRSPISQAQREAMNRAFAQETATKMPNL